MTAIASLSTADPWTRPLPNKVPEVAIGFWVLCILSAAGGSAAADFASVELGRGVGLGMPATTAITGLAVASVLIWQLALGRCVTGCYWLAATMVAALGALLSDYLVDDVGLPSWAVGGASGAAIALALFGWHVVEHPGSVHAAHTRRGEAWYWVVVLNACLFGTTIADLASGGPFLGHAEAGLAYGAVLVAAVLTHLGSGLSAAPFWVAFVLARPTGVSWGDALAGTPGPGGPGRPPVVTIAVLLATALVTVGVLTARARRSAQSGAGQVEIPTVGP